MNWIWVTAFDAKGIPVASFNHSISRVSSSDISIGIQPLADVIATDVVLSLTRFKSQKIHRMHTLPNLVSCPLVDKKLQEIIKLFVGLEVQFVPTLVRTKDADVFRFSYARPLVEKRCVDLERTKVDHWIIPNEAFVYADFLAFKPDCLDGKHLVRDTYTSHVVVSDELKDALMATGDKALRFERPEDLSMLDSGRAMH